MAVVSRIATIRISNTTLPGTNYHEWIATAAIQDTPAGVSVVTTVTNTSVGAPLALDSDTFTLRYVSDSGTIIRSVTLSNTAASQTDTFHFTSTGASGGTATCGTVEIKLQVTKTTGGALATYDVETDGTPNNPPSVTSTTVLDRGWIRGTTTLVEAASNISLGGGKNSPAQYDESLFVRTTSGHVSYVARSLTVASSSGGLSSSTNSTTVAQRDVTFSTVVDDRFPADVTVVSWMVTVPNATLTGFPDWINTSTTDDAITVDPRVLATLHFQVDDNVFALASNNTSKSMLATQSGFLWPKLTAARGTGVNGVTINQSLDPANPGTTITGTATATTTQNGVDGVGGALDWIASKPGGAWAWTGDITAPADIDGGTYLTASDTLTMLAPNPSILVITSGGPNGVAADKDHWHPGDPLFVGIAVINTITGKLIAPDIGTAAVIIMRFNQTLGRADYLDSDLTWKNITTTTAAYFWSLTASVGDPNVYVKLFSAADTADFGTEDLQLIGNCAVVGTPYSGPGHCDALFIFNKHDAQAFDGVDFATGFSFT